MRWQDAARGIPVWAGAFFFEDQTREWPIRRMCTDVSGPPTYPKHSTWAAPAEYDSSRCYPDLTDPDTRAMYLRRLAVAWGCPEEVADQEVAFRPCPNRAGWWHVYAGHPGSDEDGPFVSGWVSATLMPETTNRDLALALAWPADKRVTT